MSPYDEEDVIKEISSDIKELRKEITELKIDVNGLKIKSGFWGLLGGLIPAIAVALMYLISKF